MDRPSRDGIPPIAQHKFDYHAMDEAIRNGDVKKFSELAKTRDDNLSFRWWAWAMKQTEESDIKLQNDLRAVLIDMPTRERLFTFLYNLLRATGEDGTAVLILEKHPELFLEQWKGDCAFKLAVLNGKLEVLELFLKLVELHRWQDRIIPAATGVTGPSWDGRHKIFGGNATILDIAASMGHIGIVKALVTFEQGLLDHGYPLHAAVSEGRLDVIEYLLSVKMELVESFTPEPDPRSVLTVLRHQMGTAVSEKMDKILVSAIIKDRGEFKSPSMIRKLLKGSPVQYREICLDLSMFGQPTHQFKPMVDELVQEERLQNLSFHQAMAYVAFPFLDSSHPNSGPESVGLHAKQVLQWLRAKKGVSEIIRLIVPGSAPRAEREDLIRNAIEGISIVSLDWRVLDLSIDIILDSESKNVEELHLYSSGNWGVLEQWSGTEGVKLLPNLRRLNIVIVRGMISKDHERQYVQRLDDRLGDSSLADLKGRHLRSPSAHEVCISIKSKGWRELQPLCCRSVTQHGVPVTTLTITRLTNFLNFYKAQKSRVNIKVAIIDNGVDSTLPTLSKAVIAGVSLDEDYSGRQDPWWLASHPHGTQMANFVHQLDPFCHLYIAKVCDQATYIDPDIVADAIYWAIEQKVDIISMSITMPRDSSKLQKAVASAKNDDIVVFGSRGDKGNNHDDIYPADHVEVISISSLTNFGKRAETTEPNASYFFQGENVKILAEPCYLEPQVCASGSSVATALAAGVAALILSCRELGGSEARKDRIGAVKKVFDRMTDNDPGLRKYVKPWLVFDYKPMSREDGLKWLEARFGKIGIVL